MSPVLRATLIGVTAVLMWSTLALFSVLSGAVPPLQLVAMSFAVAAALGFAWRLASGRRLLDFAYPAGAWLVGVGGLFGYHFLYFMGVRHAPPAEANLINYMWPLLIVLLAARLPGYRLRWWHVTGALSGLAGAALLITGGRALTVSGGHALGFVCALAAAFTWAGYSVVNRRFAHVPSDAVAPFCAVTAVLAAACHVLLETTVWPEGSQWLAVLALGLGPVGGAFYVWDHGVKRGDLRVLGASAYAAPLLSTLLLVATGFAEPRWTIAAACVLIVGGAALAARGLGSRE